MASVNIYKIIRVCARTIIYALIFIFVHRYLYDTYIKYIPIYTSIFLYLFSYYIYIYIDIKNYNLLEWLVSYISFKILLIIIIYFYIYTIATWYFGNNFFHYSNRKAILYVFIIDTLFSVLYKTIIKIFFTKINSNNIQEDDENHQKSNQIENRLVFVAPLKKI